MKVSLLTRHYKNRGGLEKWATRIAEGFTQRGAEVNLLTSDAPTESLSNPLIHVHTLPLSKWLAFRKMTEFDRLCRRWHQEKRADMIFGLDRTRFQTHLRAGNGVHAAYLKRRSELEGYPAYKRKFNPLNRTILQIEKEAFESPELKILFTNSYMVKNEILEHYQVPLNKIKVIHNGVEWHEMENDFNLWPIKKQKKCEEFGLNPTHFHFLFIGSGYKRKGLIPLLHAFKALHRSDVHLSIIGKDREIDHYRKLATTLKLESSVTFFGPVSNPRPFYQIADSLVIPSHYDPFANVTVEALAMGLFVVSSEFNGGKEVLNEESGRVIEDLRSIDSFKTALMLALDRPKSWIRSQNIRESVQDLDFSKQLTSLIDISLENI